VEEERLSRRKHSINEQGPRLAAAHCLRVTGRDYRDIDVVAVGWNMPLVSLRFGGHAWKLEEEPEWLRAVLGWDLSLAEMPEIRFVPHHLAHATVSFYASDFSDAAVLITDGNGDDESISIYSADRSRGLIRRRVWPRGESVGWMYDAACEYVGLTFHEAGKLMGLASYGQVKGLIPWELLPGGEPRAPSALPDGYHYREAVTCWKETFQRLTGGAFPQRTRSELHLDEVAVRVAWSAQHAVEDALRHLSGVAREITGLSNLCLGGGVALNCKANGILESPLYAPPIPHDAGVAMGAAWNVSPPIGEGTDIAMLSPFLGPEPGRVNADEAVGLQFHPLDLDAVCVALENGRVGGVVDHRGEVGPRALGHRSIIASPHRVEMKDHVNRLKGREPWRPLGAVALPQLAAELWKDRWPLTRYMLAGVGVSDKAMAEIPAAVHVDGTTRPQVALPSSSDVLPRLLHSWGTRAGGALINTSFNGPQEPIVASATDALRAFGTLELDFVILGDELVSKRPRWWSRRAKATASCVRRNRPQQSGWA
jgi:carbamoyltransferase